ncbi:MAG: CpsD/CapB family tyrosine-protein kinase [Hahellaceae bacterium]|nr:CpsD/CapB family tyrosine-protein kinase [Hahellaceae bacterium]
MLDEAVLEKNRVIAGLLHDERAEVYRQLRSQILPQMKANGWRTLAVTSPGENAGKTLTAVNLAISIAQEVNQTVLLVDLDLRSPSVHTTLGLAVEKGVADCIKLGEPVENILLNPQFKRLVVMPGKAMEAYSSELLTSPNMRALMEEIVNRYDSRLIIFDLPPLLRNDDALAFTPQVDATLLVVENGVSTEEQVRRCLHLLENSRLIGTILNKASA